MNSRVKGETESARAELLSKLAAGAGWAECEGAAARLAAGLVAQGLEEWGAIQELREVGLSRRGAKQLVRAAMAARPAEPLATGEDDFAQGDDALYTAPDAPDDASPVCPHCLAPVEQFDHFCPKCLGPVTAFASIDPIGQIRVAGRAYRHAVSPAKRSLGVVLAMWLIFAPQLPFIVAGLWMTIEKLSVSDASPGQGGLVLHVGPDGQVISEGPVRGADREGVMPDVLRLAGLLGMLVLYTAILWKVTARHVRARPPAPAVDAA